MYFRDFPKIDYRFGDEQLPDRFSNISLYVEIIDEIKNNSSFYTNYYIKEFERPDQLSMKMYGTTNYHWTLFLLNDHIRERGWPLTNREIIDKAAKDYKYNVLTTRSPIYDKFKNGQTISGNSSGATGTIANRHLDLGQLVLSSSSGTFINGETVSSTNASGEIETIIAKSYTEEFNSAHHYEDADGNRIDLGVDSETGLLNNPGALYTEITYLNRLISMNEELKSIRILKPNSIDGIVSSFRTAIKS
jgi:hypothetical protein